MKEWRQYRLIDILDKIIDYRGKTPQKTDSGIPLITAKIIKDGRILPPNEFISESNYDNWMVRGIPHEGDVVLTVEAPLGEVAQLGNEKIALAQRVVTLRGKEGVLDNTFLKYFLMSQVGQARLKARETGTTVTGIKQSELREVLIDCPDYEHQLQIASILRAIDNKIENNRQINDNLEQQAQALYKSWFIDNYQTEWPEYSLDEVTLKITDGVHNTVIDTPNGEYYLLSCKNIKNRRLNMSSSDRRIDEGTFNKLRKRTMLSKGDILLSSVGTIGELMLLNDDPHNYEFQRSVAIIKPNPVYISSYYLYETLISQIDKITNTAHGAVQQCVFLSDLKEYTINIADKALISRYDIIVKPFFDEITKREKEIARLTSLRDSLLPKLMSGELKINEIDC